ncbi:MAG: hypothetical protein JO141_18175 [Bradyrhizobium sp.]|nr:hypothetical protein [Bradyrhizobium sp.]
MRLKLVFAVLLGMSSAALGSAAQAQGFEIVVPGRPNVPVMINGIDASYAVIEGGFGLGKGVNNQPTIYGGRVISPEPEVGHYYPSLGLKPAYGRLEIEPPANRKLPKPAESYHQFWGAQSAPNPPTLPNPQAEVPIYPPPVIMAPPEGDGHRRQDFSGPPSDMRRPE